MKKNIAFFSDRLALGGIGRAMINYVNMIDKEKYDVTLFLNKKDGIYLDDIDKSVRIISLNISESRNVILRKIINAYKLLYFRLKYHNKFYFAANFNTTIKSGAILAKCCSKNNAFWFHGEYWENDSEAEHFFKYTRALKYKKLVFVSNKSKAKFEAHVSDSKQKLYVINNLIDYERIIRKSEEELHISKKRKVLINVGRHEEKDKNLIMLIKCIDRLLKENYDFELWLIGDGENTEDYKKIVHELKLEDRVIFMGSKSNVFPYYKIADAVLLSSVREGNPVVFLEAKVLNKPIISTNVSDAKIDLKGYGIVTEINEESYYQGLKKYLDGNFIIENKFDPEKHNKEILEKLYNMIEGE